MVKQQKCYCVAWFCKLFTNSFILYSHLQGQAHGTLAAAPLGSVGCRITGIVLVLPVAAWLEVNLGNLVAASLVCSQSYLVV